VSAADRLRIRQGWAELDLLAPLLSEVETELIQCSVQAPWVAQVPYLVQVPGIGVLNAMVVLAAIGDIARFPTARHLVSYSGLAESHHASGQTVQTGRITKEGRKDLRTTLVEAAWVAVDRHPHWKAVFQRLAARIGQRKALVAVARKLLVVLWHVLSGHVADHHAEDLAVARKRFLWSSTKGTARRLGLSRAAFVRQHARPLGDRQRADDVHLRHNQSDLASRSLPGKYRISRARARPQPAPLAPLEGSLLEGRLGMPINPRGIEEWREWRRLLTYQHIGVGCNIPCNGQTICIGKDNDVFAMQQPERGVYEH
jgi:transposase